MAAFLGAVVAVLLWWYVWRSKGGFAWKPYHALPGIGKVLRWQHECAYFSDRTDSQPKTATMSNFTENSEAATNSDKPGNRLIASSTYARTEPAATHSMSNECLRASTAKSQCLSEGTAFFTSRSVMSHVQWPTSQQSLQPRPRTLLIPAPLWQDVEIAPEDICISQTSAGTDWILGQGSYGMVCFSSCTCTCNCPILWLMPKHSLHCVLQCRCTHKSEVTCMIATSVFELTIFQHPACTYQLRMLSSSCGTWL